MLKIETLENGLVKTVSDSGKYIIQNETGIKYEEAIDIPNKYTYTESEENIPADSETNEFSQESQFEKMGEELADEAPNAEYSENESATGATE